MNLVFVLVDALRADHLSCYGYGRKTSPFIDKFAFKSVLFNNAVTNASFSMSSCKSIFSGIYCGGSNIHAVDPNLKLMQEYFSENGFKTAGFFSSAITSSKAGFGKGFDLFDAQRGKKGPITSRARTADNVFSSALQWVEKNKGENFFLFTQLMDTHGPYNPPFPFNEKFVGDEFFDGSIELPLLKDNTGKNGIPKYQQIGNEKRVGYYIAMYDGAIGFIDSEFKKFIEWFVENDLLEETVFVLTSDHGEAFGEHGYYFCHGVNAYDELVRVPLIMRFPEKKGKIVNEQVRSIDILPTLLSFFGLPFKGLDGENLLPLADGRKKDRLYAFIDMDAEIGFGLFQKHFSAVRTEEWKLIKTTKTKRKEFAKSLLGKSGELVRRIKKGCALQVLRDSARKMAKIVPRGGERNSIELFNLVEDPLEKKNVFSENREKASELSDKLEELIERYGNRDSRQEKVFDRMKKNEEIREVEEQLKELGYLE